MSKTLLGKQLPIAILTLWLLTFTVWTQRTVQASTNSWQVVSFMPGNTKSPILALSVSPTKPNIIIAAKAFGPIFFSNTYGRSWIKAKYPLIGAIIYGVYFSPFSQNTVYITTNKGLLISDNGGLSYKLVKSTEGLTVYSLAISQSYIFLATNHGVLKQNTQGSQLLATSLDHIPVTNIAALVIYGTPVVMAATQRMQPNMPFKLYITKNGGADWQPIALPSPNASVYCLSAGAPKATKNFRPIVLGTQTGAYISTDEGSTWIKVNGIAQKDISACEYLPGSNNEEVLASDGGGTANGGLWLATPSTTINIGQRLPPGSVSAIAVSKVNNENLIYVALWNTSTGKSALLSAPLNGAQPEQPTSFSWHNTSNHATHDTSISNGNLNTLPEIAVGILLFVAFVLGVASLVRNAAIK
jgi:hypothetical protein